MAITDISHVNGLLRDTVLIFLINTITTHQKKAVATQSFTKTNFYSGKTEVGKKVSCFNKNFTFNSNTITSLFLK